MSACPLLLACTSFISTVFCFTAVLCSQVVLYTSNRFSRAGPLLARFCAHTLRRSALLYVSLRIAWCIDTCRRCAALPRVNTESKRAQGEHPRRSPNRGTFSRLRRQKKSCHTKTPDKSHRARRVHNLVCDTTLTGNTMNKHVCMCACVHVCILVHGIYLGQMPPPFKAGELGCRAQNAVFFRSANEWSMLKLMTCYT